MSNKNNQTKQISDITRLAKETGFRSEAELHKLVSNVNLLTPEKRAAFKRWQETDGSKEGLLALRDVKSFFEGDEVIYYDKEIRLPIVATVAKIFREPEMGEMIARSFEIVCDNMCAPHPHAGKTISVPADSDAIVLLTLQNMRGLIMWSEGGSGYGICATGNAILWSQQQPSASQPDWQFNVTVKKPMTLYTWEETEHLFKFSIRQTAFYDAMFRYRMGANLIVIEKDSDSLGTQWLRKRMSWEYGSMWAPDIYQAMNIFDRDLRSTGRYAKNNAKLCRGDLIETPDGLRGHIRGDKNKLYIEYVDTPDPKPGVTILTGELAGQCLLIDDYCYERYGAVCPAEEQQP